MTRVAPEATVETPFALRTSRKRPGCPPCDPPPSHASSYTPLRARSRVVAVCLAMVAPVGRLASPLGRVLLMAASGACLLLALLAAAGRAPPGWLAALALALLIGVLAAGVFLQARGVFARPLVSAATSRPEGAITFDDGPGGHAAELLATLNARGHRATFFVVGERAARDPQALAEIARDGHALENHSCRHSYLTAFARPA